MVPEYSRGGGTIPFDDTPPSFPIAVVVVVAVLFSRLFVRANCTVLEKFYERRFQPFEALEHGIHG